MKDEIKEINIPENVLVALGDLTNGALNYYKALKTVEVRHNTILNYIANVQEYYNVNVNKYEELLVKYSNLQEEYDVLKRDIEAMKHNYNLLVRTIENGESMTQKFENGLTYQDYKSRNEKAIEYIKERTFDEVSIAPFVDDFNCKENLLNILQGSDKE